MLKYFVKDNTKSEWYFSIKFSGKENIYLSLDIHLGATQAISSYFSFLSVCDVFREWHTSQLQKVRIYNSSDTVCVQQNPILNEKRKKIDCGLLIHVNWIAKGLTFRFAEPLLWHEYRDYDCYTQLHWLTFIRLQRKGKENCRSIFIIAI